MSETLNPPPGGPAQPLPGPPYPYPGGQPHPYPAGYPYPYPYPGQLAQLPPRPPAQWRPPPPPPPPRAPRPPEPPTPSRLPAALLAAGLVAAISMPRHWPGLGLFIGALAVSAAVLVAARHRLQPWPVCFGCLALVLVALTAVRAAPWVATVNLTAALVLGALAVSGTAGWTGPLQAVISVCTAAPRALPWVIKATLHRPGGADAGADAGAGAGAGAPGRPRITRPALRGIGITAGLFVVFGLLFASADAAFASLAGHVLPRLDGLLWFRLMIGLAAAGFAASAALVAVRPVAAGRAGAAAAAKERPRVEWALPLAALDLLFAAFVAVQLTVLFGGNAHVLRTTGLTYAQYARQGFWQLLTVAALTLAVIGTAVRLVPRNRSSDRSLLRLLLGILCALTLVVLASALRRLGLYEQVYGLTRLRVSVGATLVWLAAIFVLVLVAGALRRSPWLPRAAVTVTGLSMVVFALSNPDARIAESGLHRAQQGRPVDTGYLASLSADAVPALARIPDPLIRGCALAGWAHGPGRAGGWADSNLGRSQARAALRRQHPAAAAACPANPTRR